MPDQSPPDDAGFEWSSANDPTDRPLSQKITFQSSQKGFMGRPDHMNLGMRTVELQFNLALKLWRWTPLIGPNKPGRTIKVFTCATDDTRLMMSPLTQTNPSPGLAGAFIEQVRVRMGFDDRRAMLFKPSPQTDQQGGSATSSAIYSFNGGFFGLTPTGGMSAEYTHSATIDLTDFAISNKSDERYTDHVVRLLMLGDGRRYTDWRHAGQNPVPPLKAVSDMPLGMQGVWELPGDSADTLAFRVKVDVTYVTLPDAWNGWQARGEADQGGWDTGVETLRSWETVARQHDEHQGSRDHGRARPGHRACARGRNPGVPTCLCVR